MATATFFVHSCPTCGRRLHIAVEYIGVEVKCQHCGGRFVAAFYDPRTSAQQRVEELLSAAFLGSPSDSEASAESARMLVDSAGD